MSQFQTISPQGIAPDRPVELLGPDVWARAENMSFRTNYSMRSMGAVAMPVQPPFAPGKLIWVNIGGVDWWLSASGAGVFAWDGSTYSTITPTVWTAGNPEDYTWTLLNQVPVLNQDGIDAWSWDGNPANVMTPLPEFASYIQGARSVRAYKNFLVAIAPTGNQNVVAWSDAAAPGDVPLVWTPAPTNLAGDVELSEDATSLIDACVLRNDLIIYKREGVYLLQFVGGQFVMASRALFKNVGMLSKDCAITVDGFQYVLGDGNVYRHDGNRVEQIGEGVVRDALFSVLSTAYWYRSFVAYNPRSRSVLFSFPDNGSAGFCTGGLSYNVDQQAFGSFAPPLEFEHMWPGRYTSPLAGVNTTWDTDTAEWDGDVTSWGFTGDAALIDDLLISSADDKFYAAVGVGTWGDLPFESSCTTGAFTLGDHLTRKLVKRLWPVMEISEGDCVTFEIGTSDGPRDTIRWHPPVRCFNTTGKLDYLAQGRYIAVRMRATDVSVPYSMTSLTIEYEAAGKF